MSTLIQNPNRVCFQSPAFYNLFQMIHLSLNSLTLEWKSQSLNIYV